MGADFVTDNDQIFQKRYGIMSNGYGIDNIIIAASTKSNQPIELAGLVATEARKSCCNRSCKNGYSGGNLIMKKR